MGKNTVHEVHNLLVELRSLLTKQGEKNWIRGVNAAITELDKQDGFDRARSIYRSMNQGNGSFADYHVWLEDFDQCLATNKVLDDLRIKVW